MCYTRNPKHHLRIGELDFYLDAGLGHFVLSKEQTKTINSYYNKLIPEVMFDFQIYMDQIGVHIYYRADDNFKEMFDIDFSKSAWLLSNSEVKVNEKNILNIIDDMFSSIDLLDELKDKVSRPGIRYLLAPSIDKNYHEIRMALEKYTFNNFIQHGIIKNKSSI